jgi:hypothetical protein
MALGIDRQLSIVLIFWIYSADKLNKMVALG